MNCLVLCCKGKHYSLEDSVVDSQKDQSASNNTIGALRMREQQCVEKWSCWNFAALRSLLTSSDLSV